MIAPFNKNSGSGGQPQVLSQEGVVENIADQASKSVVTITIAAQQQRVQTFS